MSDIITFNVPKLAIRPILDINGNAVSNPTPLVIEGIQGFDLMLKGTIKELMADKQFAIAAGRGESSVQGKIKAVQNSAEIIASVYTGQGWSTTTPVQYMTTRVTGTLASAVLAVGPAGAGIDTGTGTLVTKDLGVVDLYGNVLTCVGATPAAGQYTVAISSGTATYTFNSTEVTAGMVPYVSFIASLTTPATGTKHRAFTINNLQGGQTPVVELLAYSSFQGRSMLLTMPWTISSNLNLLQAKNLDFSGFELDFTCLPDRTVNKTIVSGFCLE